MPFPPIKKKKKNQYGYVFIVAATATTEYHLPPPLCSAHRFDIFFIQKASLQQLSLSLSLSLSLLPWGERREKPKGLTYLPPCSTGFSLRVTTWFSFRYSPLSSVSSSFSSPPSLSSLLFLLSSTTTTTPHKYTFSLCCSDFCDHDCIVFVNFVCLFCCHVRWTFTFLFWSF